MQKIVIWECKECKKFGMVEIIGEINPVIYCLECGLPASKVTPREKFEKIGDYKPEWELDKISQEGELHE